MLDSYLFFDDEIAVNVWKNRRFFKYNLSWSGIFSPRIAPGFDTQKRGRSYLNIFLNLNWSSDRVISFIKAQIQGFQIKLSLLKSHIWLII